MIESSLLCFFSSRVKTDSFKGLIRFLVLKFVVTHIFYHMIITVAKKEEKKETTNQFLYIYKNENLVKSIMTWIYRQKEKKKQNTLTAKSITKGLKVMQGKGRETNFVQYPGSHAKKKDKRKRED